METPRFLSDIFPQDQADLSWIPMGKCSVICPLELMLTMGFNLVNKLLRFVPLFCRMDVNSSYRLAMRVGAYVKFNDDGSRGYCNACNIPKIFDRDSTNWNDLLLDIGAEIKLGHKHKLCVTFWNKMSRVYEEITSDQKLLDAIDMYWDVRRLSLQVCVMRKDEFDSVHDIERQQSLPCLLQGSTDAPATQISAQSPLEIAAPPLEPPIQSSG